MSAEKIRLGAGAASISDIRVVDTGDEALDAAAEVVRRIGIAEGARLAAEREAASLAAAAERLDAFGAEAAEALSRHAVELAVEITRHLLRVEVDAGRYDLERIVREALSKVPADRSRCVVHVNPDDAAALRQVRFREGTSVDADVDVRRGDVHVETSIGLMVRELDSALASIRARLLEDLH